MSYPHLPAGAGISGGYSGSTWTIRLTYRDRTYSATHAHLWDAILDVVAQYRRGVR